MKPCRNPRCGSKGKLLPDSEFHTRQVICRTCLNARRRANRDQRKVVEEVRLPVKIDPIIGQVLMSKW